MKWWRMMKKIIPIIIIVFAITILVTLNVNKKRIEDSPQFEQISLEIFKDKLKNNETFSVYVYSTSCSYSKKTTPVLENILLRKKSTIFILDANQNRKKLEKLIGPEMQVTPSLFSYKNSHMVDSISGMPTEEMLVAYLERNDV